MKNILNVRFLTLNFQKIIKNIYDNFFQKILAPLDRAHQNLLENIFSIIFIIFIYFLINFKKHLTCARTCFFPRWRTRENSSKERLFYAKSLTCRKNIKTETLTSREKIKASLDVETWLGVKSTMRRQVKLKHIFAWCQG